MARKPLDIIVAIGKNNNCYKKGTRAKMTGIVFHSTAANNPYLKRYVNAPAEVGVNTHNNHWDTPNPGGRSVCVHAFIGYDINNKLRVAQTLPYDYACWGVGSGTKGSFNSGANAKIQFEMCEDSRASKAFLDAMLDVACQYAAELCIQFGWDPLGKINGLPVITDHQEAHSLGWGGNHGDVRHWLKPHGYDLNYVRNKVEAIRKELLSIKADPLKSEGDDIVTQAQFNEMYANMIKENNAKPGSNWSEPARQWAVEKGLFAGDASGNMMWQGLLTREQAAQIFYNNFRK